MPTPNEKLVAAYKKVFDPNDTFAKLVLAHLCKSAGVLDGGFVADASLRDFNAGQRHIVLSILANIGRNKQPIPTIVGLHQDLEELTRPEQVDDPPRS